MDAGAFFQSKGTYLNASHVAAGALTVTIERVQQERVGRQQDDKLVIYFQELPRGLVLNKVNFESIYDAYGPETSGWLGKRVTLYAAKTEYDGKEVDAVRIRIDPNDYVPHSQWPKPEPAPMEEEVPF